MTFRAAGCAMKPCACTCSRQHRPTRAAAASSAALRRVIAVLLLCYPRPCCSSGCQGVKSQHEILRTEVVYPSGHAARMSPALPAAPLAPAQAACRGRHAAQAGALSGVPAVMLFKPKCWQRGPPSTTAPHSSNLMVGRVPSSACLPRSRATHLHKRAVCARSSRAARLTHSC